MNIYTNKDNLKNKCLKQGDHVLFWLNGRFFDYLVCRNYLSCALFGDDKIFIALGLDAMGFSTQCYGYSPIYAEFPKCDMDDYESLTRLVIALFEECEKVNNAPKVTKRYLW